MPIFAVLRLVAIMFSRITVLSKEQSASLAVVSFQAHCLMNVMAFSASGHLTPPVTPSPTQECCPFLLFSFAIVFQARGKPNLTWHKRRM
jgi:hypothetical protein